MQGYVCTVLHTVGSWLLYLIILQTADKKHNYITVTVFLNYSSDSSDQTSGKMGFQSVFAHV